MGNHKGCLYGVIWPESIYLMADMSYNHLPRGYSNQKEIPRMKITYDRDADAMSIVLADAEVEETKSVAPGFFADYDADGRVIALEILRTAQKYDFDLTDIQPPSRYMSLSDAGQLYGLSPTTLRHQIGRGVLKGKKFGRNWMVHHRHMADYVRERSRKSGKSGARSAV